MIESENDRRPGPRTNRGERNLTKKEDGWHIELQCKGKRIRRFGGYTKEQARNVLAKLRLDLINENLGFKRPEIKPVPFETFADEFLEIYCKQNKRSWRSDENILIHLKEHFKGETLQSIGPEKVARYMAERRADVSPSTVNRARACLMTLFNKAVEWGRSETNPIAKIKKFKEPPGRERILTADESDRLIKSASESIRPVLITALHTGMRRGEILSLRWPDLDFPRRVIFIKNSKSGKPRKIPMSDPVYKALHDLPRVSEFVFYNRKTKTNIKDIKNRFHEACRKAKKDPKDTKDPGIVGLRFHDLRHTAASMMIKGGVPLVTVSKFLGHSSIQMTMRYVHETPEDMRLAVDRLAEMLDLSRQKVATVKVQKSVTPRNYAN